MKSEDMKYCKHCHKEIMPDDVVATAEAIGAEGKIMYYFHGDCFFSLMGVNR